MSTSIDERVVSMKFDNAGFEKGAAETLSTLDKLKAKLNFSDAFSEIDSSPISSALDKAGEGFSKLNTIAVGALLGIGNTISREVTSKIKEMTDQLSQGWKKYEEITKAEQMMVAQGYEIEEVNAALEELSWFTDETSYNLADMTSNIGKFTAQGQDLSKSVIAMQGISTWAGKSGAGIEQASRAMYNLSQALGMGSVKLQDWMSIENANMATKEFKETVIETAKELGYLDKNGTMVSGTFVKTAKYAGDATVTFQNFRNTLSAGWFDSTVLMKTLEKYGSFSETLYKTTERFGVTATEMLGYIEDYKKGVIDTEGIAEKLGIDAAIISPYIKELTSDANQLGYESFLMSQQATTLSQAIDAVKDAVSTGWMKTFQVIFGDYEKATSLWSDFTEILYDIFAEGGNLRNAILSTSFSAPWDEFSRLATAAGYSMSDLKDMMIAVGDNMSKNGHAVSDLVKEYGGFYESLQAGWLTKDIVVKSLDNIIAEFDKLTAAQLKEYGLTKDDIAVMKEFRDGIQNATSAAYSLIGAFKQRSSWDDIKESILNILQAVRDLMDIFDMAFDEVFFPGMDKQEDRINKIADVISKVTAKIRDFTRLLLLKDEEGELNKKGESIKAIFVAIASVIKLPITLVQKLYSAVSESLGKAIGSLSGTVLSAAGSMSKWVTAVVDMISKSHILNAAIDAIGKVIAFLYTKIKQLYDILKSGYDSTIGPIVNSLGGFEGILTSLYDSIVNIEKKFKTLVKDIKSPIKVFQNLKDAISGGGGGGLAGAMVTTVQAADKLDSKISSLKETFGAVSEVASVASDRIQQKVQSAIAKISDLWGKFTDWIKEEKEKIKQYIEENGIFEIAGYVSFIITQILSLKTIFKASSSDILGSIGRLINGFGDTFLNIEEVIKSFSGVFNELKNSINTFTKGIKAGTFKKIAEALLMIAGAVAIITLVDQDTLANACEIIALFMLELSVLGTASNKIVGDLAGPSGTISSIGKALLEIAVALKILESIENVDNLNQYAIILGGIAALIMILAGVAELIGGKNAKTRTFVDVKKGTFTKTGNNIKDLIKAIGSVMLELSISLLIISKIEDGRLLSSCIAMGSIFVALGVLAVAITKLSGKVNKKTRENVDSVIDLIKKLTGMMTVMVLLMAVIGLIPEDKFGQALGGLIAIFVTLGALLASVIYVADSFNKKARENIEKMVPLIAALTTMISALAAAFYLIGKLDTTQWILGLAGMTALLLELVGLIAIIALIANMPEAKKLQDFTLTVLTPLTAVILAMALAMKLLATENLGALGSGILGLTAILVGLLGFILALAEMNKAGLLDGLGEKLLAISIAFVAMGASVALLGVGLLAINTALLMLGSSSVVVASQIVAFLSVLLTGIAGLEIPLTAALTAIGKAIINSLNTNLEALTVLIDTFLNHLMPVVMSFIDKLLTFIMMETPKILLIIEEIALGIVKILTDLTPKLGELLKVLVFTILDVLRFSAIDIAATVSDTILQVLRIINSYLPDIMDAAADVIVSFLRGVEKAIPRIIDAGIKVLIAFINGIADGIRNNQKDLDDALENLILAGIDSIFNLLGDFKDFGEEIIKHIMAGLSNLWDKLKGLVSDIGESIKDAFSELLGIESPSKVFEKYGEYIDEGLENGLENRSSNIMASITSIGEDIIDGMGDSLSTLSSLISEATDDIDVDPVIRPVVDLSDVKEASKDIYDTFNESYSAGTVDVARNIADIKNDASKFKNSSSDDLNGIKNVLKDYLMGGTTQNNTFNITGNNDPKEVANEVSKILQNQVERRSAQWA